MAEISVQMASPQDPVGDFNQMAQLHKEAISEGFLSTLGADFLVILYQTLADCKSSFVITAKDHDKVLGFIVGSLDTGEVYAEFRRRAGARAIIKLLPRLLSWARIKRVLETLLYPKSKRGDDLPEPEILNFCVGSASQGQGVGSILFQELCSEFQRRGTSAIRIVTGESQVSAQRFYEKHGATLAKSIEVHKGSHSRVYVFKIADSA